MNILHCENCGSEAVRVLESRKYRLSKDKILTLLRRRECASCGHRWSTGEVPWQVVKEVLADE